MPLLLKLLNFNVARVWERIVVQGGAFLEGEEFFGFMKFKYKTAQMGNRLLLSFIPGLLD